jgi:hypothetical protein
MGGVRIGCGSMARVKDYLDSSSSFASNSKEVVLGLRYVLEQGGTMVLGLGGMLA